MKKVLDADQFDSLGLSLLQRDLSIQKWLW